MVNLHARKTEEKGGFIKTQTTNRVELLRAYIDNILHNKSDKHDARCGFVHLYGVAAICSLLAEKRNLDKEIANTIGMLHDIAAYITGDPKDHAKLSSIEAKLILDKIGGYNSDEIDIICNAISLHSNKLEINLPYDELLKDADVLQHHYYNTGFPTPDKEEKRLNTLKKELSLN